MESLGAAATVVLPDRIALLSSSTHAFRYQCPLMRMWTMRLQHMVEGGHLAGPDSGGPLEAGGPRHSALGWKEPGHGWEKASHFVSTLLIHSGYFRARSDLDRQPASSSLMFVEA